VYIPDIELHEVTTLEDAATEMQRYAPSARFLAGGTDLIVDLKSGRVDVGHLISLNRIESLRGVVDDGGGLRVGALTTVTELDRSPFVRDSFPALLDATRRMAIPQIRNVATVGGNICSAVPCADLPPILTALRASIVLLSPAGQRNVPLDSFFTGARQTIRRDNEVLSAVIVPKVPPRVGVAYVRFSLRNANAIAVASVAASLQLTDDGTIKEARIVLGAVAPVPAMARAAGEKLAGQPPDPEAFRTAAESAMDAADPICDVRGSADYRRTLVGVLTQRALNEALRRTKESN
jgi:carbon-monoxide dehydrogenase medium subunit